SARSTVAAKSDALTRNSPVLEAWARRCRSTARIACIPVSDAGGSSGRGRRRIAEARNLARVNLAGLVRYGGRAGDAAAQYCTGACADHSQRFAPRLPGLRQRTDAAADVATVRCVHSNVPEAGGRDSPRLQPRVSAANSTR